jgi:hypothetical protein
MQNTWLSARCKTSEAFHTNVVEREAMLGSSSLNYSNFVMTVFIGTYSRNRMLPVRPLSVLTSL